LRECCSRTGRHREEIRRDPRSGGRAAGMARAGEILANAGEPGSLLSRDGGKSTSDLSYRLPTSSALTIIRTRQKLARAICNSRAGAMYLRFQQIPATDLQPLGVNDSFELRVRSYQEVGFRAAFWALNPALLLSPGHEQRLHHRFRDLRPFRRCRRIGRSCPAGHSLSILQGSWTDNCCTLSRGSVG
jgi:hypothetical protein